jgi:hypothetical protein
MVSQILPGYHPSRQDAGNEDNQNGPFLAGNTDGPLFIDEAYPLFIGRQEPALGVGLVPDVPFHRCPVAVDIEDGKENGNLMALFPEEHVFFHIMGYIHHRAIRRRDEDIVATGNFVIPRRATEEIGEIDAQDEWDHGDVIPFHITQGQAQKKRNENEGISFR